MWARLSKQSVPALRPFTMLDVASGAYTGTLRPIRPFTIAVEGNIGCGKTTFLNHFADRDSQVQVVTEPVSQWRNVRGFNLLQLMYDDPRKWGFSFQTHVQLTMLKQHMLSNADQPVKMMERSVHSARYCFVENLWNSGLMETEEKAVLDEWYHWLQSQDLLHVDLTVYLRASPETVQARMQARARGEETGVSLDTLRGLHRLHEDWLVRGAFPLPSPVVVLDAERPLEEMVSEYLRCDQRIKQMIVPGL